MKAVSDTVLDMINADYHDKPLMFIGATFPEKVVSHHWAENIADLLNCKYNYASVDIWERNLWQQFRRKIN